MRSRFKKFQRNLGFYKKNFGFLEPFQILIDGTFANAVLAGKVNMKEQLPKYFEGACKLYTTPCVLIETEGLGPSLYGAVQVLKGLQLCKCLHSDKPVPAAECLKSMPRRYNKSGTIKDEHDQSRKFVIATQDANLRSDFREVVGVPLLYLYGSASTMEKPSGKNVKWAEKRDKRKLEMTGYQKEILQHFKEELLPGQGDSRKGTKKRKRAGPNPLSCKKAKKMKTAETQPNSSNAHSSEIAEDQKKKKRKRVKVRLPKHVKELIGNQ